MSIDQFTDELNIKELFIAEPVKKILPINAEDMITDGIWDQSKSELFAEWNSGGISWYGERLTDMLILSPQRKNELLIPSFEDLESRRTKVTSAQIRIIYPEKPLEAYARGQMNKSFKIIKRDLTENKDDPVYWMDGIGNDIWNAFILYPENFDELKSITGLSDTVNKAAVRMKEQGQMSDFLNCKLMTKLLGKDPKIQENEWEAVRQDLEKRPGTRMKLQMAARIKMLQAKEVKMAPEGLKITMPEPQEAITDAENPVPERRKF